MPTNNPSNAESRPTNPKLVVARAEIAPIHINRTGFEEHRAALMACGYDPDTPADMSICEWLVHCWSSDG